MLSACFVCFMLIDVFACLMLKCRVCVCVCVLIVCCVFCFVFGEMLFLLSLLLFVCDCFFLFGFVVLLFFHVCELCFVHCVFLFAWGRWLCFVHICCCRRILCCLFCLSSFSLTCAVVAANFAVVIFSSLYFCIQI